MKPTGASLSTGGGQLPDQRHCAFPRLSVKEREDRRQRCEHEQRQEHFRWEGQRQQLQLLIEPAKQGQRKIDKHEQGYQW